MIFSWNSIDAVRGENMIRAQRIINLDDFQIMGVNQVFPSPGSEVDNVRLISATLRPMLDRPVYEFTLNTGDSQTFALFDAVSGQKISPINRDTAREIAIGDFTDEVEAISVELIESVGSHSEYRGKELPAYRVVLDHSSGTVIYVSANRGVVTTRRNNRWRVFDFFWMLHTMDYQGRDNFNHWVLKGVSIFGLVTVLTGFVLWFKTTRLFRRKSKHIVPDN